MCSWAVMSGYSSAHRVWADEHVLTSSYERVLICSSRKFYQAYFNKIYSISSGLNGPYEQMSMCSWAVMSGCSSAHRVWAGAHLLIAYEHIWACAQEQLWAGEHVLMSSYEHVLIRSCRMSIWACAHEQLWACAHMLIAQNEHMRGQCRSRAACLINKNCLIIINGL